MNIYESISNVLKESVTPRYLEINRKSVTDNDGFNTDYVLYHDTEDNKYVTVFGDSDIYKPEDENFDMKFDTEKEAKEWFDSYTGLDEGENFKETPKSIESLKSLLEQLADKDFNHNMKDNWTQEDFMFDSNLHLQIKDVINQLKKQGIETKYRMGYPIEYSDDIKREDEESKLSNEEYFKLHEDDINELPNKEEFLKMESYNADGTEHHDEFAVTNDGINEEYHETLWAYVSKHGIGPGTVPSDIKISHVYDVPNTMKTIFCSDRELTKDELSKYELSVFDSKSDPELLKALFSAK